RRVSQSIRLGRGEIRRFRVQHADPVGHRGGGHAWLRSHSEDQSTAARGGVFHPVLNTAKSIQAGSPQPQGATWTGSGVNFAVFSSHATRIEVCIFDAAGGAESARYELPGRTGDIWHGELSPHRAQL